MSDIWTLLHEHRNLTTDLRQAVIAAYRDRGEKALRVIDEGRVIRYRDFFVVRGAAGEYIVDEDFCTCGDFLFRKRECAHILAVRIAGITGTFVQDERWYQDLMRERSPPRSRTGG